MALSSPRNLTLLTVAFAVALVVAGREVWLQDRRVRDHRPVEAEVVRAGIDSESVGTGTSRTRKYVPEIHYRYEIDGRVHEGHRVTPVRVTGSRRWAEGVVGRYPVGERVTAYVDPEEPRQAFLVREVALEPYTGVLGAVLGVGLCVLALLLRRRPGGSRVGRIAGVAAGTLAAGMLVVWHYHGAPGTGAWIAVVAGAAFVVAVGVGVAVVAWRMGRVEPVGAGGDGGGKSETAVP